MGTNPLTFPGQLIGSNLLRYRRVGSTMDVARQYAEDGAPDGTVVVSREQTGGRGRFQRVWVSPPDTSIHLTAVLRPNIRELSGISIAASLAIVDCIQRMTKLPCTVKWPNDVRIRGKKVAGILVETSIGQNGPIYALLGIGVNVNLDPSQYPEIATIATSLYQETSRKMNIEQTLGNLLWDLDTQYRLIKEGHSPVIRWRNLLDTLNKKVNVSWGNNILIGIAEGVDSSGNLLLRQENGILTTLEAGEVSLQT